MAVVFHLLTLVQLMSARPVSFVVGLSFLTLPVLAAAVLLSVVYGAGGFASLASGDWSGLARRLNAIRPTMGLVLSGIQSLPIWFRIIGPVLAIGDNMLISYLFAHLPRGVLGEYPGCPTGLNNHGMYTCLTRVEYDQASLAYSLLLSVQPALTSLIAFAFVHIQWRRATASTAHGGQGV